jgi:putative addiction module killer protein
VVELKIDHGPGYRVYFALYGETVVLLLCGGDKRTQRRDLETAKKIWKDHQERKK